MGVGLGNSLSLEALKMRMSTLTGFSRFVSRSKHPENIVVFKELIQGPEFDDLCKRGEPVACGQKLRLEHLTTNRLSSCHLLSPSPFPGTCTATTSHPHSPTSRRFLLLERWEKGTQEMYGR